MSKYEDACNLMYSICMTSVAIKDSLKKEFLKNGFNITIDNFMILSCLWKEDNLSQQELCKLTGKTQSNLTRIIEGMEKKRLIMRSKNPNDRRSFSVALTTYSIYLKDNIITVAEKYSNRLFDKITKTDIENLNRALSAIHSDQLTGSNQH